MYGSVYGRNFIFSELQATRNFGEISILHVYRRTIWKGNIFELQG
jgi:hypothetical protein